MWQALLIAGLHAVTAFGDAPTPSAADPTLKLALDSTEVFAGAPTFLSKDTPVPAARDGQGRPLLSTALVTLMAGTSPSGMAPSLLGFFLPIYAGQSMEDAAAEMCARNSEVMYAAGLSETGLFQCGGCVLQCVVDAFSKGCAVINSNLDQSQIKRD